MMCTVSLSSITWFTSNSGSDGGAIKFEMYDKLIEGIFIAQEL